MVVYISGTVLGAVIKDKGLMVDGGENDVYLEMCGKFTAWISELNILLAGLRKITPEASVNDLFSGNTQAQRFEKKICTMIPEGRYKRYFTEACERAFLCDVEGITRNEHATSIESSFSVIFFRVDEETGQTINVRVRMGVDLFIKPHLTGRRGYWPYIGDNKNVLDVASY